MFGIDLSWLAFVGPFALVVLTYGLHRLQLFVRATITATPKLIPPVAVIPSENQIEAYYKRFFRDKRVEESELSTVIQAAQFAAVERATPQLVTIYDPSDVKVGNPLAKTEDFPFDDTRRSPTSGHPAAGTVEDVVILDYRALPNEMHAGFIPTSFADRYRAKVAARVEVLKDGSIRSGIQRDITNHAAYRTKQRQQAKTDFEDVLPSIKAKVETLAREKFVPPRMDAFKKEAAERGIDVEKVIEEFVSKTVKDAELKARDRFNNAGPLNDSNEILKALTPDRLRQAGAWPV